MLGQYLKRIMSKHYIKLIQARSATPEDVCFESLLKPEYLTLGEIECSFEYTTQEWQIASWDYDTYHRTPTEEKKWKESIAYYIRQFETDIT